MTPRRLTLVAGAAGGTQGSTGLHVTRLLRERGHPIRALVHHDDHRAQALRQIGIDVVGDLRDIASIGPPWTGSGSGEGSSPTRPETGCSTRHQPSLPRPASRSNRSSRCPSSPWPRRGHAAHAPALGGRTGLRLGRSRRRPRAGRLFYENLQAHVRDTTDAEHAQLALPLGGLDTEVTLVSAEDVGHIAAAIFESPGTRDPGLVRVVGQILTVDEIIEAFNKAAGRAVQYVEVPSTAWHQAAEQLTNLRGIFRAGGAGTTPAPKTRLGTS